MEKLKKMYLKFRYVYLRKYYIGLFIVMFLQFLIWMYYFLFGGIDLIFVFMLTIQPLLFFIVSFLISVVKSLPKLNTFKNSKGERFRSLDIVIDPTSPIKPKEKGILKFQPFEGYFIVYLDGMQTYVKNPKSLIKVNEVEFIQELKNENSKRSI